MQIWRTKCVEWLASACSEIDYTGQKCPLYSTVLLGWKSSILFISLCISTEMFFTAFFPPQNHVILSVISSLPAVCCYFWFFWVSTSSCTLRQANFLWSSLFFRLENRLVSHESRTDKHGCNTNWCICSKIVITSMELWYLKTIIAMCFSISPTPTLYKVGNIVLLFWKLKQGLLIPHCVNPHCFSFYRVNKTATVLTSQQHVIFM